LKVTPTGIDFRPNPDRVLIRPFIPSCPGRVSGIIDRVLSLNEAEAEAQLASLRAEFGDRHAGLEESWLQQFAKVRAHLSRSTSLSASRRLIIGAFFSGEYAIESTALCNPSIVPHPDQSDLGDGDLRFILTLRAIGEGHISSIEFRTGVLGGNCSIEIDKTSNLVTAPKIAPDPSFPKSVFVHKLNEHGLENNWSRSVLDRLGVTFTRSQLDEAIQRGAHGAELEAQDVRQAIDCVHWLIESNYELDFNPTVPLGERVIFPVSLNESNGIEDARFVRFVDEDQSGTYYATYTAYNGRAILPQLIETTDFLHFRIRTLNGATVQNKGMALFPRRIDGHYAMISRHDDENLHLMFSDDPYFWSDPQVLSKPVHPWEFVKIGNCGSPIETDAGWLVLTHGVGPMRKYCIGAVLLDLKNPSTVIGRLDEPLLKPMVDQKYGYVPNVVYTCGALVHQGRLILPYGLNDTSSTIVTIELETLLEGV